MSEDIINLSVPESKKDREWIEWVGKYYNFYGKPASEEKAEILCWNYFNNQMQKSRFNYILKKGKFHLPANARHIPEQRHFLDSLISQQSKRPFVFSVMCFQSDHVAEKNYDLIMQQIQTMRQIIRQRIINIDSQISQVDQKMQSLQTNPILFLPGPVLRILT